MVRYPSKRWGGMDNPLHGFRSFPTKGGGYGEEGRGSHRACRSVGMIINSIAVSGVQRTLAYDVGVAKPFR